MAYISGTYSLKYYKEFTNQRNEDVRFEIHQKGTLSSAMYPRKIGDFRQLRLRVQGGQDEIDTPIVKTSLEFSVVDSWDKSSGTVANSTKYGNWDEFYTPDSTEYLCIIKTKAHGASTYTTRWSGYITPDNWQEQIAYYGEIVVTARDNIGHLQDFDFDATGDEDCLISVQQLVTAAMQKICLPMDLVFNDSESGVVESMTAQGFGTRPSQLLVSVDAFKKKNWLEAVEETLNSIGYALRFCDNNRIVCASLRYLEQFGSTASQDTPPNIVFLGGGTRRLSPAYKKIVETIDFGFEEDIEFIPKDTEHVTAGAGTYPCVITNASGTVYNSTGDAHTISARTPNGMSQDGNMGLDPSAFVINDAALSQEGDEVKNAFFIVANRDANATQRKLIWQQHVAHLAINMGFEFTEKPAYIDSSGKLGVLNAGLYYVEYQIRVKKNNTIYYLNDQYIYSTTPYTWSVTFTPSDKKTGIGAYWYADGNFTNCYIQFVICNISYKHLDSTAVPGRGVYARLKKITLDTNWGSKHADSDVVTTVNNDNYNIKVERKSMFGCLSIQLTQSPGMPQQYLNAFFLRPTANDAAQLAPYSWIWSDENAALPFPAQVHKQLLMYHHSTNEVLEGDCMPESSAVFAMFNRLYMYKGVKHLLQSGVLDFVTGRFNSALLRHFLSWSELWHGVASTLSVSPSSLDLSVQSGGVLQITSNTSWIVSNVPNGLQLSVESGTGNATVTVARTSAFTHGGNLVFKTADNEVTVSVYVSAPQSAYISYQGPSDTSHIYYEDGEYMHSVYISYDPDEEPMNPPVDKPSWLHFNDSDLENGECPQPGQYYFYVDELQAGVNSRTGTITVYCYGAGVDLELDITQPRW